MQRFTTWMAGTAMAVVAAGCGGDGTGKGGISPTGPLFVGITASVTVSCPSQMEAGTSGTCNAYGYDSNGTYTNSNESSWSSSNTSVATISSRGGISAVGAGTATISAVIDGITGSTGVTVVNPSPLSVTIGGPDIVSPNTSCMWWANVSGGSPPYTYSWTGGSGGWTSGNYYYATTPGPGADFALEVVVTDNLNAQAVLSIPISVSDSYIGPCPS